MFSAGFAHVTQHYISLPRLIKHRQPQLALSCRNAPRMPRLLAYNKHTAQFSFPCSQWKLTISAAHCPCHRACPAPFLFHGQRPSYHRGTGHPPIPPTGLLHRIHSTTRTCPPAQTATVSSLACARPWHTAGRASQALPHVCTLASKNCLTLVKWVI